MTEKTKKSPGKDIQIKALIRVFVAGVFALILIWPISQLSAETLVKGEWNDLNDQYADPGFFQPKRTDDRIKIVYDLQRLYNKDILVLTNGDKLTGRLITPELIIQTAYAKIAVPTDLIAGVDLDYRARKFESVYTVNNNRFSGFVINPNFTFELDGGTEIIIRKEKALKVIKGITENERDGIPQTQFVLLSNGDFFSGLVQHEQFMIKTSYATIPMDIGNLSSLTFLNGDSPITKVEMLNGDKLQGNLLDDDITIKLDIGVEMTIYKNRIFKLFCRNGYVPDLNIFNYFEGVMKLEDKPIYGLTLVNLQGKGSLVTKIGEDTPAEKAGIKANDVIVRMGGVNNPDRDYCEKVMELVQQESIKEAVILVHRGERELVFKVVR